MADRRYDGYTTFEYHEPDPNYRAFPLSEPTYAGVETYEVPLSDAEAERAGRRTEYIVVLTRLENPGAPSLRQADADVFRQACETTALDVSDLHDHKL